MDIKRPSWMRYALACRPSIFTVIFRGEMEDLVVKWRVSPIAYSG